jgi:ABC-type bacteriocin/lantibiotic exporter with double-glycine peptidase domain
MFFNPVALFVFSAFLLAIYVTYARTFRDQILKMGREVNINVTDSLQISQDALRGYKEITVFGKTHYFVQRFREKLQAIADQSVLIDLHRVIPRNLIELSVITLTMMSLLFLDKFSESRSSMIATFTVLVFAAYRLMPLFTSLTQTMVQLRSLANSISQLYGDCISMEPKRLLDKNDNFLGEDFESLEIKGLNFSYEGELATPVKDISLDIKRGDIVGLFGPSGVGKTTLVNIIIGLIKPSRGDVFVNGRRRNYDRCVGDLKLAYLPQDTLTMNTDVVANVMLSDYTDPDQASIVKEALEVARLDIPFDDIIVGERKTLGEQGGKFSGGQRQRIAIARAIYHKKDFFVFDEATNALDANLENQIVGDLIKSGRMVAGIIISHRASTLRHCNRIIEMKAGNLREVEDKTDFFKNIHDDS